MARISMKIIYLLVIILIPFNLIAQSKDSIPSNNRAEIDISFFKDGALATRKARIKIVVNGVEIKSKTKDKFILDNLKLSEKDLVKFRIYYKKYCMETQEYQANLFLKGGTLLTGVISDYFSEKKKFLLQDEYFVNNVKNKRDLVLRRVTDSVTTPAAKPLLIYSVINWPLTEQIMIRYNFFPRF